MAEQNLHLNKLLSDPVYFSDLCNGVLFRGEMYLKPEDLMPVKGSQGVLYADRKGVKKVLERRRDVAMRLKSGTRYAVIAVENQANIHYAMVIRSLLYDALDYADQVQIQEKELRQAGRRPSGDGFLSGVGPKLRLEPVVTLVLYWGSGHWDGSTSLHELLGLKDGKGEAPELAGYIPDYRLNLVNAANMDDPSIFRTHLQQIFSMLKYKSDKAALYRYAQENRTELRDMDGTAKLALLSMMGEQKRLQKIMEEAEGEEEFDMCKAIDDLIADGESRGFERGDRQGFERGERQLSSLISRLLAENRPDLIEQAVSDPDVRARLYKSYHL